MPKQLTNNVSKEKNGTKLSKDELRFKIAITGNLFNDYDFKKLKKESNKTFHTFLDETVGKQLSITSVESLFLKTKGKPSFKEVVNGKDRDVFHFGKKNTKFRIFGYYNDDGYFVICRIDPNHNFQKV